MFSVIGESDTNYVSDYGKWDLKYEDLPIVRDIKDLDTIYIAQFLREKLDAAYSFVEDIHTSYDCQTPPHIKTYFEEAKDKYCNALSVSIMISDCVYKKLFNSKVFPLAYQPLEILNEDLKHITGKRKFSIPKNPIYEEIISTFDNILIRTPIQGNLLKNLRYLKINFLNNLEHEIQQDQKHFPYLVLPGTRNEQKHLISEQKRKLVELAEKNHIKFDVPPQLANDNEKENKVQEVIDDEEENDKQKKQLKILERYQNKMVYGMDIIIDENFFDSPKNVIKTARDYYGEELCSENNQEQEEIDEQNDDDMTEECSEYEDKQNSLLYEPDSYYEQDLDQENAHAVREIDPLILAAYKAKLNKSNFDKSCENNEKHKHKHRHRHRRSRSGMNVDFEE